MHLRLDKFYNLSVCLCSRSLIGVLSVFNNNEGTSKVIIKTIFIVAFRYERDYLLRNSFPWKNSFINTVRIDWEALGCEFFL